MTNAPTTKTYSSLDAAYDHFNRTLFAGQLPPCLITMQRHKGLTGISPASASPASPTRRRSPTKSP